MSSLVSKVCKYFDEKGGYTSKETRVLALEHAFEGQGKGIHVSVYLAKLWGLWLKVCSGRGQVACWRHRPIHPRLQWHELCQLEL